MGGLRQAGRVLRACLGMLVVAGSLVAVLPLALAQMTHPGVVKGFKLPEFYQPIPGKIPPNRLKSLVTGAEARPETKDLVAIKGMRLESYQPDGRTNVIAKAPECMVDLEKRQVNSSGALELVTGDGRMSMVGTNGFLCRMTNFNMVISNHVRTVIHHAMLGSKNL